VRTPYCVRVSYEYANDPRPDAVCTMHHHVGQTTLTLTSADTLEGEYYPGRVRQTFGAIKLTRSNVAA
jgi:hypothetical protein